MAEPSATLVPDETPVVPVFFLSDSTGIRAETMGNALLIQFPDTRFERTLFPFITTVEEAQRVVAILDEAMDGPVTPLVFTTAAVDTVRSELAKTRAPVIDFFDIHMSRVEEILGRRGLHEAARLHGVGDIRSYNIRMAAVEFTIEHDDGQSIRSLEKADVILTAPSRCGKTPTSMYLALQHGLFVANYPLVDEDLERADLPGLLTDTSSAASASPPPSKGSAGSATNAARTPGTPPPSSAAGSCVARASCTPRAGSRSSTPRPARSRRWPP